jgi:hypothetical protein
LADDLDALSFRDLVARVRKLEDDLLGEQLHSAELEEQLAVRVLPAPVLAALEDFVRDVVTAMREPAPPAPAAPPEPAPVRPALREVSAPPALPRIGVIGMMAEQCRRLAGRFEDRARVVFVPRSEEPGGFPKNLDALVINSRFLSDADTQKLKLVKLPAHRVVHCHGGQTTVERTLVQMLAALARESVA